MFEVEITLNSAKAVQKFCRGISKLKTDINLSKGRYVIDAKSIMGVLSLDLSSPVMMQFFTDDQAEIAEIQKIIGAL